VGRENRTYTSLGKSIRALLLRGVSVDADRLSGVSSGMLRHMFMLHSRLAAKPGRRNELLAILNEGEREPALPGCRLYVVALDEQDPDGVWVTEIWVSGEAHAGSLEIDRVREQIVRATPLIDAGGIRQQQLDALSGIPR
jgi:quinol monooxygenase YgiN